jgi:hypothetical protein
MHPREARRRHPDAGQSFQRFFRCLPRNGVAHDTRERLARDISLHEIILGAIADCGLCKAVIGDGGNNDSGKIRCRGLEGDECIDSLGIRDVQIEEGYVKPIRVQSLQGLFKRSDIGKTELGCIGSFEKPLAQPRFPFMILQQKYMDNIHQRSSE